MTETRELEAVIAGMGAREEKTERQLEASKQKFAKAKRRCLKATTSLSKTRQQVVAHQKRIAELSGAQSAVAQQQIERAFDERERRLHAVQAELRKENARLVPS